MTEEAEADMVKPPTETKVDSPTWMWKRLFCAKRWVVSVATGGHHPWRFGALIGRWPVNETNTIMLLIWLVKRWPQVSVGTMWRRIGCGVWPTDPDRLVRGCGPFWWSVRTEPLDDANVQ